MYCWADLFWQSRFFGFTGNLFNPYWYLGAQVVFLGLGILHVNLLHHYFRKHFTSTTRSIIFDCVLSITCIAFGGYLFVLIFKWISTGLGNPFMAATVWSLFVIPLLFYYCYIPLSVFLLTSIKHGDITRRKA
jgi:hypothetical protein